MTVDCDWEDGEDAMNTAEPPPAWWVPDNHPDDTRWWKEVNHEVRRTEVRR
jgi:hypothetical protein